MRPFSGPGAAPLARTCLVFIASCVVFGMVAGNASAAAVPCTSIGGGKFNCSFFPAGNGISGGAPVQASNGQRVGYLNQGTNYVFCQAAGGEVASGAYHNKYWAYTKANNKAYGWVNAVWARGGTNDGPYGGGVPTCAASIGRPPGTPGTVSRIRPQGSVLPAPVNMGSYGTYDLRFQLFRASNTRRRANFTDWTPAQMMSQLNSKFSHYFTFTGCGDHLRVGQRCRLDTTLAPDGPVEVIAVSARGFALLSLQGHPEGAGRTIRFEFQTYTNAAEISSMSLSVQAWGPLSRASLLGELNSRTTANTAWSIFANNVKKRFPDAPPGGVCNSQGCPA